MEAYHRFRKTQANIARMSELLNDPIYKEAVSAVRESVIPTGVYDTDNPDEALKKAGLRRVWEAGFHSALRAIEGTAQPLAIEEQDLPQPWEYEQQ